MRRRERVNAAAIPMSILNVKDLMICLLSILSEVPNFTLY
jgi:hypothetical protein